MAKPATSPEIKSEISTLDTFAGGVPLTVTHRDGTTIEVRVGEIRIKDLGKYQAALGDEEACVELFANQEKGWAATLTNLSLEAILEKGEEINRPFLMRKIQREIERMEAVQPGSKARMAAMQEKMLREQLPGFVPEPATS